MSLLWLVSATHAGEVVRVNGERFDAELASAGRDAFVFRPTGENAPPVRLAAAELVRWSHPATPRPRPFVLLAEGSQLVAAEDWSDRGALQLGDETLTVATTLFDDLVLPRRRVTAAVLRPPNDSAQRQRLVDELREFDGRSDMLWLAGGDRITGTVQEFDNDEVAVTTESGDVNLPLSRVVAIAFNPQLVDRQQADGLSLAVGLQDGSLVRADSLDADADQLRVEAVGGPPFIGGTVGDVAFLQTIGNPAVAYLSDLEPADYRHVPYLDVPWTWRADRNLLGGPPRVGENDYVKGIAMHSAGRLTFALDGTYRRFLADVAVDDAAGRRGSVVFRVFVARDGKWEDVLTTDVVRGGDSPLPVSVDVDGAAAITLIVDFADRGDELDHADWLDARLVQ